LNSDIVGRRGGCMSSPYGLQLAENCLICKLRDAGFFCDLPRETLLELERIKYASGYPQGAVLFVEGQSPRGVYIVCSGRVKLSTTSREGKTSFCGSRKAERFWAYMPRCQASRTS